MKVNMPADLSDSSTAVSTRLGWVSYFNDCSSEVIARALPLFLVTGMGLTPAFVGIIEGLAEALSILLKGFSGWLSDQMESRKPLIVFGYLCSFLARVLLLFVQVPVVFGATRLLDRTGKGIRSAPRDAMVADSALLGNSGRAFGMLRFLDTLGAVTGLLVVLAFGVANGSLDAALFRNIVLISLPFGLVSLLLLMVWVPRLPRVAKAKKYISFTIPKGMRSYLGIIVLFALGNSSDAFLVLRAKEMGFEFSSILWIFVFFNILAAALAVPMGRLSDRFGRVRFLAAGWFVYAVAYAIIAFTNGKPEFVGAMTLYGAFYGFTEGVEKALLADILAPDERGVGYGALQLGLGLSALPASFLTGTLMTHFGSRVALGVCAALALAGTVALIIWGIVRQLSRVHMEFFDKS